MKKLELTIASDYVPSWTIVDGIRELFQNALDQGDYNWHFAAGTLTLTSRNTRRNRLLTLGNETKCLREWANDLGIDQASLRQRLDKWPLEKALTTPKRTAP